MLGLATEEYTEALLAFGCFAPPSLQQPASDVPDLTLGDLIVDPDRGEEAAEARSMLEPLLQRLSERDRHVLRLRFVDEHTQREIADLYGLSQVQVSRWLARICCDLRSQLEPGSAN